eukprot:scaffold34826_cov111-Phaeocystis_antarctica.AAC.3
MARIDAQLELLSTDINKELHRSTEMYGYGSARRAAAARRRQALQDRGGACLSREDGRTS